MLMQTIGTFTLAETTTLDLPYSLTTKLTEETSLNLGISKDSENIWCLNTMPQLPTDAKLTTNWESKAPGLALMELLFVALTKTSSRYLARTITLSVGNYDRFQLKKDLELFMSKFLLEIQLTTSVDVEVLVKQKLQNFLNNAVQNLIMSKQL